jgi:hypothetical protein
LLVREGYDSNVAENTAERLFGTKSNIQFPAIDGTKSEDEALEMIVFYAVAFGYTGKLDFNKEVAAAVTNLLPLMILLHDFTSHLLFFSLYFRSTPIPTPTVGCRVMLINFGHDKRQYADSEKDAEGASSVALVLV